MKWIKLTENNIPEEEVLCLGYQEEMLIGYVGEGTFSRDGFVCENEDTQLTRVTHFISLKDLWALERE